MSDRPCPSCHGARLKPFPRAVTVGQRGISDVTGISVGDAARFFGELKRQSQLKFGEQAHAGRQSRSPTKPMAKHWKQPPKIWRNGKMNSRTASATGTRRERL